METRLRFTITQYLNLKRIWNFPYVKGTLAYDYCFATIFTKNNTKIYTMQNIDSN